MVKLKDLLNEGKYTVYFDMGSPGLMSKTVDAKDEKEAEKRSNKKDKSQASEVTPDAEEAKADEPEVTPEAEEAKADEPEAAPEAEEASEEESSDETGEEE